MFSFRRILFLALSVYWASVAGHAHASTDLPIASDDPMQRIEAQSNAQCPADTAPEDPDCLREPAPGGGGHAD